jgi:RNA polymerase sigma factor (sigma-70 family)
VNENEAGSLADPAPDPEMVALRRERVLALGSALNSLSPRLRLIVRLRFQQELTLQEIARVMNLSNAQAADRLLQQAFTALRHPRLDFLGKTKPASV